MGNPRSKNGTLQRSYIHVSIEIIAADVCKIYNIGFSDSSFMSNQCLPYFQFIKIFSEGMNDIFFLRSAGLINISNFSDRRWMSLNSGALHIMKNPSDSAHLLTATGTPRTAMNQMRHRGTMPC